MLEKTIFTLVAFSLLIIIFFKIVRKNDFNYGYVVALQLIGIIIGFIQMRLGSSIDGLFAVRYILSIVLPVAIIIIELRGINFSEMMSIALVKFLNMTGNTKAAKAILVSLVTKYPQSYLGHKYLAEYYEKDGGMRRAIDEYVTAVDINKKDYKSYFKIADLLRDLGKKDEAIEMLENLVRTKPDCYEGSCLLGELLCEQERFKEAANVYQEALKYKPTDYDLYYNLGIVYTRLSDFQMAKEMYEMAAEINHRMYGAKYNLGLIAFIQKDYDTAEKYFEESLYEELEAKSYYQLAKIYVYKGEKDKAINFLNKAIELEPKLLDVAVKDKTFNNIKEYITVSVKMDEKESDFEDEMEEEKEPSIMQEQEILAREYLEEAFDLIEDMSENFSKQKIDEKLDYIFNKEKQRKAKERYEAREKILREQQLRENNRQKELGTNE